MLGYYDYTVILTYLSAVSAVIGIIASTRFGNTKFAVICLMLSGLFDMFDGKVASTKKNRTADQKDFGIQIDSMCDLVAFGVLPVCIGISLGIKSLFGLLFMVLYVLAAIIRLSFFNVQEKNRQAETDACRECYRGLPVTMSAVFIPLVFLMQPRMANHFNLIYQTVLLVIALLFVLDFKVKKADKKMMIGLCVVGLLIAFSYIIKGV